MKSEITLTLEEYNSLIEGRDDIMNGKMYIISSYTDGPYHSKKSLYYLNEAQCMDHLEYQIDILKSEIRELKKRKWYNIF